MPRHPFSQQSERRAGGGPVARYTARADGRGATEQPLRSPVTVVLSLTGLNESAIESAVTARALAKACRHHCTAVLRSLVLEGAWTPSLCAIVVARLQETGAWLTVLDLSGVTGRHLLSLMQQLGQVMQYGLEWHLPAPIGEQGRGAALVSAEVLRVRRPLDLVVVYGVSATRVGLPEPAMNAVDARASFEAVTAASSETRLVLVGADREAVEAARGLARVDCDPPTLTLESIGVH